MMLTFERDFINMIRRAARGLDKIASVTLSDIALADSDSKGTFRGNDALIKGNIVIHYENGVDEDIGERTWTPATTAQAFNTFKSNYSAHLLGDDPINYKYALVVDGYGNNKVTQSCYRTINKDDYTSLFMKDDIVMVVSGTQTKNNVFNNFTKDIGLVVCKSLGAAIEITGKANGENVFFTPNSGLSTYLPRCNMVVDYQPGNTINDFYNISTNRNYMFSGATPTPHRVITPFCVIDNYTIIVTKK